FKAFLHNNWVGGALFADTSVDLELPRFPGLVEPAAGRLHDHPDREIAGQRPALPSSASYDDSRAW
uniref:hypothetical protein n=1 Tax=Stenotrophomonas pavanii TaxID=487698 RepID=UPI0039C6F93E